MKNLIYQYFREVPLELRVPHSAGHQYHECSKSSINAYAESIGAEYKFFNHVLPVPVVQYGIFIPFEEGWCDEYDNVCFIDSDILATKRAENIFDSTNVTEGLISVYIEERDVQLRHPNIKFRGHANTGVVIFPRSVYNEFSQFIRDELDDYEKMRSSRDGLVEHMRAMGRFDQPFINLYIERYGDLHKLTAKFNWVLTRLPYDNSRWDQSFIHYNGHKKHKLYDDFRSDKIFKE